MLSSTQQVLAALLLSLAIHVLVALSVWPHMQEVSIKPLIVQGELIAPKIEEPPPPAKPLPPPTKLLPSPQTSAQTKPKSRPVPRKTPVPRPQHKLPTPISKKALNAGVALPLLAEKADTEKARLNDYVVPDVPLLAPGSKLPMASKPAEAPPKQSIPVAEPSSEQDKITSESNNGEDLVDRAVLAAYSQGLWKIASQSGGYPLLALQRDWEGMVKVQVRYTHSGVACQVSVKNSSGHNVLDEQAVEMVKQACAHYALPDALTHKAFSVIVPIEFKLM